MSVLKDYLPRFGPLPAGQSYAATPTVKDIIVSLTAAQIIAMGTTPITLIPAPGTGKVLALDRVVAEINRTSTAFTGGGVVHLYYHGQTTELMAQTLAAASITGASGQEIDNLFPVQTAGGSPLLANTAIDITNATAAFAAGTGTMKLFIRYRIIPL